ncbi:MAG TPA: S8 family serine peptidase, partial [Candidatus Limnocylindrales bacterium]
MTFRPGTSSAARANTLAAAGAQVVDTIAPLGMAVVRMPVGSDLMNVLGLDPAVLRVERDRVRSAEAAPDDPAYATQWSLPLIGWDKVYGSIHPTGSSVVAILDTGVDAGQPELVGRLVPGIGLVPGSDSTVDPNGHGTAMAGIVAAATDNRQGIAGIGYAGVRVMPVTVLDANGLGQDSDIIAGIVWAVDHGANVINLSFSNPGYSAALQAAIDYAWDHDVVVVAATGNDGSSAPTYPAGDRGVIGVSNTNQSDQLDANSNHGADTFLAAPGTDIVTLQTGGGLTSVTGTSASSAEVAAAAALLRAIDPDASNGVIVGRLARTAADVGTRSETGNGRL